jgi:CheY-like chemotaxis protein
MTKKQILIIEDEEVYARTIKRILERTDLYETHWTANGQKALEFLEQNDDLEIFCVISDIKMPDMNGLEFITNVREKNIKNKNVPIAMITAYEDFEKYRACDFETIAYLKKPIDRSELLFVLIQLEELGVERMLELNHYICLERQKDFRIAQLVENGQANDIAEEDLDYMTGGIHPGKISK